MRHSDSALQAIFLREVTELASSDLWLPGSGNGFTLTLQPCGLYHLRRLYNLGGQSRVLCCGTYEDALEWTNRDDIQDLSPCECTWAAYQKA